MIAHCLRGLGKSRYAQQSTSPAYTLIHQLNALVSLLVTAAKSMLLLAVAEGISQYKWLHYMSAIPRPLSNVQTFDSASRGPWGAIKMLASIRAGYGLVKVCLP